MPVTNRLHLDFSLETIDERNEFISSYIQQPQFKKKPLTTEELNTISNYILWGKDPSTGKNLAQVKEIEIDSRNKTWVKEEPESLDAIIETSSYDDILFKQPTEARPKIPRVVFSRTQTLRECPEDMRDTFKELFAQIDRLDLGINIYEWSHGRRRIPPREELVAKFSEEEQEKIRLETMHWNQYIYLKKRHLLVEMRRQQFTLRDIYTTHIERHNPPYEAQHSFAQKIDLDAEIKIFPLGLSRTAAEQGYGYEMTQLLFRPFEELLPQNYTEEDLEKISRLVWIKKHQQEEKKNKKYLDFRELEHVYQIFNYLFDLEDFSLRATFFSSTSNLLDTLFYYMREAHLSDIHRDILEMKIRKCRNQDIAYDINHKYGRTYTANYISTIFRHKIIPKINEAAMYHEKIVENLFFEEEFKRCTKCGKMLLKDTKNFGKKSRSKDGFSTKCKICDKEERDSKKWDLVN